MNVYECFNFGLSLVRFLAGPKFFGNFHSDISIVDLKLGSLSVELLLLYLYSKPLTN